MSNIYKNIATLFFIGYLYAPGTIASFLALFFVYILNIYLNLYLKYLVLILLYIISFISIDKSLKFFKSKDPKEIVIDEFSAVCFCSFFLNNDYYHLLYFFMIFRFFDISKIFYIKYIEILSSYYCLPFSILIDDIIAVLYSIVLIKVVLILQEI